MTSPDCPRGLCHKKKLRTSDTFLKCPENTDIHLFWTRLSSLHLRPMLSLLLSLEHVSAPLHLLPIHHCLPGSCSSFTSWLRHHPHRDVSLCPTTRSSMLDSLQLVHVLSLALGLCTPPGYSWAALLLPPGYYPSICQTVFKWTIRTASSLKTGKTASFLWVLSASCGYSFLWKTDKIYQCV